MAEYAPPASAMAREPGIVAHQLQRLAVAAEHRAGLRLRRGFPGCGGAAPAAGRPRRTGTRPAEARPASRPAATRAGSARAPAMPPIWSPVCFSEKTSPRRSGWRESPHQQTRTGRRLGREDASEQQGCRHEDPGRSRWTRSARAIPPCPGQAELTDPQRPQPHHEVAADRRGDYGRARRSRPYRPTRAEGSGGRLYGRDLRARHSLLAGGRRPRDAAGGVAGQPALPDRDAGSPWRWRPAGPPGSSCRRR